MFNYGFFAQAVYAVLSGCVNTPYTKADVIRTRQLREHLHTSGFVTFAAMGSYLGNLEPSIFVVFNVGKDINEQLDRVMQVAKEFNQRQIFFANKGVFTAPFVDAARESYSVSNEMVFGTQAMSLDGFTEAVTSDGSVIFSVPDLYETERDVPARVSLPESKFAIVHI